MRAETNRTPADGRRGQLKQQLDPFNSATWNEEEREYFTSVERAFQDGGDFPISNGKPAHAAYLIKLFIANAESKVRLVSGGLPLEYEGTDVFGSYYILAAILNFLSQPDTTLHILVQGKPKDVSRLDAHPIVQATKAVKRTGGLKGKLIVQQLSREWENVMKENDMSWHWMTMDSSAYRLETDVNKPQAIANFGDKEFASGLVRVFDTITRDTELNQVVTEVSSA